MFALIKTVLPTKTKTTVEYQGLNKQYATTGNSVGNPVFIKEEMSCKANLCAKQLYEIGPWLRLSSNLKERYKQILIYTPNDARPITFTIITT